MKKATVASLKQQKRWKKIVALTAYDCATAEVLDKAGVDLILVGDSLGMVVLGYPSTRYVTMDEMIHHAKAVRRGVHRALLVGDMPYRSYESPSLAYRNAVRFIHEAGCEAVKLDGGRRILKAVRLLRKRGVQVQGHLGLLPQSVPPGEPFRLQ
ncbi:MAG: 3-methyl-2-oxobutanoate hydroxymethyltransferase, partial [Candidatus Omnitrophota bacterium]